VVSVTSDVTASASHQSAPPKAADRATLPDASQLASSFASMVDSKQSSDASNLLPPAQQPSPPPPPQRSANDNSPPSRNTPSNNNSQAPSAACQNQTNQASNPPASNNNDPGNSQADANNGNSSSSASQSSGSSSTKSDSSKSGDSSSTDKGSTDTSQSADASAAATPVNTISVAQVPIVALPPVAINMLAAASASTSGNSGTPLTIAAAAIATAASTASAVTAASTAATTDATASTKTGDATTTAKTQGQAQAPATGTAAAPQTATAGIATPAELALAAAAGTPGTTGDAKPTTGLKTTGAQGKTATTTTNGTTPPTDPSATANPATTAATPQPTVDAKADATNTLGAAIKPEGDAAASPSVSSTTGRDHSAGNAQAPTPSVDPNAQAFALPQQQLSAAASVSGTDKLTATQATGGAVPLSGLAVEIAASAKSGKTSFEVRLDPAELGRIDVKIDVDRNGQVTSHLTVEKPETLSMLRQDAPQLQQALNDAGLKTGSGGLQFSLRDQSSSGQNGNFNQSGGQPQRLVISEDDSVPAAIAGRSYGRTLGASGGVDISV